MPATQPMYEAYLLRTWQEEGIDESASPTCYYLLEQLLGARQRWLFTDVAALHLHLQGLLSSPSSITPESMESRKFD